MPRRGWVRSFYYWMEWPYESKNDIPDERSVKLKQLLMRQISLSKLKLKHIETKQRVPPDLQKIDNQIISDETIYITPMNSPIKHVELSQKQQHQLYNPNSRYSNRL
jgi:hypothetical protein